MIIYQFFNQDFLLSEVINCGQLDKTRHHFTQPPSKPHICHTKNRLKPSFRLQPVVCLQNHQYHAINLSGVGSCIHHQYRDRHLPLPALVLHHPHHGRCFQSPPQPPSSAYYFCSTMPSLFTMNPISFTDSPA